MSPRHDPYSYSIVRLPERDLAEVVLEFASPLLAKRGAPPSIDDARSALTLAISFWNASVLASKHWSRPRVKELNELKKRLRGRQASQEDAAMFDLLTERWREHWLDPRLIEHWAYEPDESGVPQLTCKFGLPDGVRAEIPPPIEKRIAIGGVFLDEVRIRLDGGGYSFLNFPYARHHGVVAEDGTATVYAMMPSALQLLAEGKLPRLNSDCVDVVVGGRALGPMVLTEVRCVGHGGDVATLVFKPAGDSTPIAEAAARVQERMS
jgi:hypothetical protein